MPPVVDIVQMENSPLPAPSTSRTPQPRSSLPSTPHVASTPPSPQPTPDVGLRIKGSARHTQGLTVHLAPAAAEPTGSDLANLATAGPAPTSREQAPSPACTKRKTLDWDSDDQGPLLSDYMCPICFSPPKSAIITPCGHILCGGCLHGAISARPVGSQALCPVCRTPIPNLQFTLPVSDSGDGAPAVPPVPPPRTTRRHVPPASRNLPGGFRLPTRGEDMVDLDALENVIDVDANEIEPQRAQPVVVEEKWDPARSGVVGLEILTMEKL